MKNIFLKSIVLFIVSFAVFGEELISRSESEIYFVTPDGINNEMWPGLENMQDKMYVSFVYDRIKDIYYVGFAGKDEFFEENRLANGEAIERELRFPRNRGHLNILEAAGVTFTKGSEQFVAGGISLNVDPFSGERVISLTTKSQSINGAPEISGSPKGNRYPRARYIVPLLQSVSDAFGEVVRFAVIKNHSVKGFSEGAMDADYYAFEELKKEALSHGSKYSMMKNVIIKSPAKASARFCKAALKGGM